MSAGFHHHRRQRSTRTWRTVLMVLGLTGLAIGAGFVAGWLLTGNPRLRLYGIIYILVSVILLGVREILKEMRRQYRRRQQSKEEGARPPTL